MENKSNNTLLTVLAVATLLVALAGASFAYFTATGEAAEQNVSTGVLKISATAGSVKGSNVKPVLPAAISTVDDKLSNADVVKLPITVDTTGTTVDSTYNIFLTTATVENGKGLDATTATTNGNSSQIKWELVKVDSLDATTGTTVAKGDFANGDMDGTTALNTSAIAVPKTAEYYMILIYIEDNEKVQDDLQGMTITATTTVKAQQSA